MVEEAAYDGVYKPDSQTVYRLAPLDGLHSIPTNYQHNLSVHLSSHLESLRRCCRSYLRVYYARHFATDSLHPAVSILVQQALEAGSVAHHLFGRLTAGAV